MLLSRAWIARLEAIVDDERWLVYVHMCTRRRVIQVCRSGGSGVWAAQGLGCLFDEVLLVFLVHVVLKLLLLLLAHLTGLGLSTSWWLWL